MLCLVSDSKKKLSSKLCNHPYRQWWQWYAFYIFYILILAMMCSSLDSPEIEAELETVHSGVNVQVEFAFFLENHQNYFCLPFSHFSSISPLHPSSIYSLSPSFFLPLFLFSCSTPLLFFPHSSFFSPIFTFNLFSHIRPPSPVSWMPIQVLLWGEKNIL